MTVFLSYSHGDGRFATLLTRKLLSAGLKIETFFDSELLDPAYDFLREARLCLVLYSRNSVLTECVKLSNRLRQARTHARIFVDRAWEPNPQASLVFDGFPSERMEFDREIAFRRLSHVIEDAEADQDEGYESLGGRSGGKRGKPGSGGIPPDDSTGDAGPSSDACAPDEAAYDANPGGQSPSRSRPSRSLRKILSASDRQALAGATASARPRRPSLRRILKTKD